MRAHGHIDPKTRL